MPSKLFLVQNYCSDYTANHLIHKFKVKLLHNEEEFFCTKTKLLNLKLALPLAKLVMVRARLVTNGLVFSGDTPVDTQIVTFLLLSDVSE